MKQATYREMIEDVCAWRLAGFSSTVCGRYQDAAERIKSLQSRADALAAAISQYLEARIKPDQTALSVTGLCKALNDYLDFTEGPNPERDLIASRGRNE